MTIKQVLESRGIYSVELELELLRAIAGEKQEYYQPFYPQPSPTTIPLLPPFEITCRSPESTFTVDYS